MTFYCMKGEYHLELINKCIHLLVGSKMIVAVQIFHKIGFSKLDISPPPLVVWNDLYKDHMGLFIILIYSL